LLNKKRDERAVITALLPRFFVSVFYAVRTPFQQVFDKSFSYPADQPLKASKTAGFYLSKCVGRLSPDEADNITPANKGRKVWGVGKSRRHWANDAVISA